MLRRLAEMGGWHENEVLIRTDAQRLNFNELDGFIEGK
jgi:hypothetical protein